MDVITKRDAIALGKKRYFTGKPCKRGHVVERLCSNCCCIRCHNDTHIAIVKKRPEINQKAWSKWAARAKQIRTQEHEQLAGRPKPDVCDVCGGFSRAICFDHDHATDGFRGWLCHNCNVVLGLVKDRSEILTRLAAYLNRGGSFPGEVHVHPSLHNELTIWQ